MPYLFFTLSIAFILIVFLACLRYRPLTIGSIFIGMASAVYSLTFDILMEDFWELYYYIDPDRSALFMIFGALFIYTPLNIIYTLFLPEGFKKIFIYTCLWTAALYMFEMASLATGSLVFTGWKPIPWSVLVYAFTYLWIIAVYKYFKRRFTGWNAGL